MNYVLSIFGIFASFYMIKYREKVGDMLGEAEWMSKVGGIYTVVIFLATFIFFWSVAELTGTTDYLFAPVLWLFPHTSAPAAGI
jgi:hypothetical protein